MNATPTRHTLLTRLKAIKFALLAPHSRDADGRFGGVTVDPEAYRERLARTAVLTPA